MIILFLHLIHLLTNQVVNVIIEPGDKYRYYSQ